MLRSTKKKLVLEMKAFACQMKGLIFLLLCVILIFAQQQSKHTMVWMCLERCGESSSTIQQHLNVIKAVAPRALTAVSFERYDLGVSSSLVRNPKFTDVLPFLKQVTGPQGYPLRTFPMITSVKIDYMRQVFANPMPFIEQAIAEAQYHQYTGYNIGMFATYFFSFLTIVFRLFFLHF